MSERIRAARTAPLVLSSLTLPNIDRASVHEFAALLVVTVFVVSASPPEYNAVGVVLVKRHTVVAHQRERLMDTFKKQQTCRVTLQ